MAVTVFSLVILVALGIRPNECRAGSIGITYAIPPTGAPSLSLTLSNPVIVRTPPYTL